MAYSRGRRQVWLDRDASRQSESELGCLKERNPPTSPGELTPLPAK
ncbi:hypothetical protein ACFVZD_25270 [Streptomyces sp. NPDC058287]